MEAELKVTFGKAWYKLVATSVAVGAVSALATYVSGKQMFKAGFRQTELVVKD
jgi:hypothetical protein